MSEHDPLKDELERLPREIEPERDLWPAIEARIQPRGAREPGPAGAEEPSGSIRRWRPWGVVPTELVAAAAALVVFVAGWGVAKLGSGDGEAPPVTEAPPPVAIEDAAAADYEAAQSALLATLENGGIAPETVALIRRDLAAMDEAVDGFRVALESRPDDPRLQKQLNNEVRRRQHVLRRIAGIQIAGLQLGGEK